MTRPSFVARRFSALFGAVIGLVLWLLTGLALVELGSIDRFDPFHAVEDPPPHTSFSLALEWSFAVFAAVGAVFAPRLLGWLIKPNQDR